MMVTVEQSLRPRFVQALVEETLADTPITVIQGARQVGKSTLARQLVQARSARVVTLDNTVTLNAAKADPDAFVRQTDDLLVIDEVQRAPELILAVKDAVDEDRRPARFLLTGSTNLLELPGTEESLAGRAETIVLHGLSQGEIEGQREDFIHRLFYPDTRYLSTCRGTLSREQYLERVCAGGYPEPLTRPAGRRRDAWFANYIGRIIARDAQDLSRLRHLDRLPALLQLLAASTSGELNRSRVARDADIPETTLPPYLSLLESLYLIHVLPPWGENLTRRVTGRPKVSLLDTGLAAHLNHVTPAAMSPGSVSDVAGGLLESFAAGELRRQLAWTSTAAGLFHFRDRNGLEVDIVLESRDRHVAGVEMKAAGRVTQSDFKGLAFLRDKLKERFTLGVVLHTGSESVPFGDRLWALPYSALWT